MFGTHMSKMTVSLMIVLVALVGSAVADTTNDRWIYVPGLTPEEQAIKESVKGHATGVITNGDWRLFAILSGTTNLQINVYSGGWSSPVRDSWIAGEGRLDLSLPVFSEDGQTQYCFPNLQPNCFRTHAKVTEFIAPRNITSIGNYIFYQNGGSLTNIVIDCPDLASMGEGIVYGKPALRSLTLKSRKLAILGNEAFYNDSNLSTFDFEVPGIVNYRSKCFYNTKLGGADPAVFHFEQVTNVGDHAFNGYSGLKGDCLRLEKLQTLGQYGFRSSQFNTIIVGFDELVKMSPYALAGASADTVVIGAGPAPLTLGTESIPSASHHLYFRGARPSTPSGTSGIYVTAPGRTTVFFRADEPGWSDLETRAPTSAELELFQSYNADVSPERLVGVVAAGSVLGNNCDVFLAYGDYGTKESRLIVAVDPRYAAECPVTPAAGVYPTEYAAGERIVLSAPAEVVQVGDIKVQATKYVVSEIDDYGHWTKNVMTNDYLVGAENAVTMPAKGSLKVEWIFDEAYSVKLAPRLTAWYPEQVTYLGEDVPGELWIAKGGTCTLVARAETDEPPKTRFLRWEGDIGDVDPENPTLTLTVSDALRVKAVFAHDWYLETAPAVNGNVTMTDGNWTLKVRRLKDTDEGRRTLIVGQVGAYSSIGGAIVSGSGPMDLSTRVTDSEGNEYDITQLAYNSLRPGVEGNPKPNACTDFTAPTTLTKLGQYLFYEASNLTNVTLNCPVLDTIQRGQFMLCKHLRRCYFSAPLLEEIPNGGFWEGMFESCSALVDLQLDLPKVTCIPMKFAPQSPLTNTDCTMWNLDSVTNVMDWAFGNEKLDGPYGELRLPALEVLTGSRQFFARNKISKIVFGSGKLRLLGEQGATAQSADVQAMDRPWHALGNMTGLRHIELGLAPDAVIPDGVFSGLGMDKVTNLTFTAAPPSNTNIFAAVAAKTTVPADGTKGVRVWANWDNPGWREGGEFAATAADLGILGREDLTDTEKTAYGMLTGKERKRWMGLVYDDKRFGWLFHYGDLPNGLLLMVK